MFLSKIFLVNFRNYNELKLDFNKNINIFIGNNAQGKTNILESIYVLSVTKSHRCNKDLFLIKNDCLFTKIRGDISNSNNKKNSFEILINKNGKRVSINNNILKKTSEYLSNINVVMFCPDDLEIVKGSPIGRRKFLNIEIGQFNNNYIKELTEYNKILKNRNEYLKNSSFDKTYFDIITEKLIDQNIKIYKYRKNYIENINKYISKIYKNITGKDKIEVKYETFIDSYDEKNIKNDLFIKYDNIFNGEIYQKMTLIGIHRDDFSIYIDNIKINNYGSQGQHRIAILCFKLAELEMYKEFNIKPILLLDDIFSELDQSKKNNIIKYIKKDLQVFITATDLNNVDEKIVKNADIFYVDNGKVIRGEENGRK